MLHQLIELVREKNIFRWDKKKIEIKLIATILYYAGISLRKTSKIYENSQCFYFPIFPLSPKNFSFVEILVKFKFSHVFIYS